MTQLTTNMDMGVTLAPLISISVISKALYVKGSCFKLLNVAPSVVRKLDFMKKSVLIFT